MKLTVHFCVIVTVFKYHRSTDDLYCVQSLNMGFVVDLDNVSDEECEHILRVIRQDFLLRENDRFKLR